MSEILKIDSINEYIETKLATQIGNGRRYHDQSHFEQVRADIVDLFYPDGIEDHHNLNDDHFTDPDEHGLTYRQSIILAALLGLSKSEFSAFSQLIQSKNKLLPADAAPPGSPDYIGLPEAERFMLRRDELIKLINERYITHYRLKEHNNIADYPPHTIRVEETHTSEKIGLVAVAAGAVAKSEETAKPHVKPKIARPPKPKKASSGLEAISKGELLAAATKAEKMVDLDALINEAEQLPDDETPTAKNLSKAGPAKDKPPSVTNLPMARANTRPIDRSPATAHPSIKQPVQARPPNRDVKTIIEKAGSIKQAITDVLALQTGTGKRYETKEHVQLVVEAAAAQFKIAPDVLRNPDNHPLSIGQSQLLGEVMGLGNEDFLALRRLIDTKGKKFPEGQANPYRDRIDPDLLASSIQALIKNNAPRHQIKVDKNITKPSADIKIQRDEEKNNKAGDKEQKDRDRELKKAEAEQKKQQRAEAKAKRAKEREERPAMLAAEHANSYAGYKGGDKTKRDLEEKDRAQKIATSEKAAIKIVRSRAPRSATSDNQSENSHTGQSRAERRSTKTNEPAIVARLDMAFTGEFSGNLLLRKAREEKFTMGEVLEAARERLSTNCKRRVSGKEFSELLGITPAQYGKFVRKEEREPPLELMNKLAIAVGAGTDEEKIEWRKLILGINEHRNQKALDIVFDRDAVWKIPDKFGNPTVIHSIRIDPEATGEVRKEEVYKFLKLLSDRLGLANFGQLSGVIHENCKKSRPDEADTTDTITATDLQKAILQLTSGNSRRIEPERFKAELESLAMLAYPDDNQGALRAQCIEFLSGERYLESKQEGYVSPYKKTFRGIVTPENLKGNDLLNYAINNKIGFGYLIRKMRQLSDGSEIDFQQALGITANQYRTWISNEVPQIISENDLNGVSIVLGAKTEEEKTKWRQYMLDIPFEYNQGLLDRSFSSDGTIAVDAIQSKIAKPHLDKDKTTDEGRLDDIATFIEALRKRHGVVNVTALAAKINDVDTSRDFRGALERLKSLGVVSADTAVPIAEFAFPGEHRAALRESLIDYLSNPPEKKLNRPQPKLIFPDGKSGKELLQHAHANQLDFASLLTSIQSLSNDASNGQMGTLLGIAESQYRRLKDREYRNEITRDVTQPIALALGAEGQQECEEWHQYINRELIKQAPTLTFPEGKKGRDLLQYAQQKNLSFGAILKEIRHASHASKTQMASWLGMDFHRYSGYEDDKALRITLEDANALAKHMGAETEEEMTLWRKQIFCIPMSMDQSALNSCFDDNARYKITVTNIGAQRTRDIANFVRLLRSARGLNSNVDLAMEISKANGLGEHVGAKLSTALTNLIGSEENVTIDPRLTHHKSLLPSQGRLLSTSNEYATMIARYAFPDNPEQQKKCTDLFSKELQAHVARIRSENPANSKKTGL